MRKVQLAAANANNNANGRVPSGRIVNSKPLTADISLNAADVGALNQQQGDNRYEMKGFDPSYTMVTVYSGSSMSNGQTVNLNRDCRGCWFYFVDNDNVWTTPAFMSVDNIECGINSGGSGSARLRLENNGTVIRCISSGSDGVPKK